MKTRAGVSDVSSCRKTITLCVSLKSCLPLTLTMCTVKAQVLLILDVSVVQKHTFLSITHYVLHVLEKFEFSAHVSY